MSRFNLDEYEPVEDRLARFHADHVEGRVLTDLVSHGDGTWIVKATVYRGHDDVPDATGYAHEKTGDGMVNRTSALENCETSAVGRALANLGYAPKGKRPSREEMAKVQGAETENSSRPAAKPSKSSNLDMDAYDDLVTDAKADGVKQSADTWTSLREYAATNAAQYKMAVERIQTLMAEVSA